MPLNIYTSNRMENLIAALAHVLREPLAAPLAPEVIVVQSKGMQRWVAMELAKHFGVWANCNYPFPNSMVWRLFSLVLPDVPDDAASFAPEVLTWKIMGLLPGFLDREEFAPLQHYLVGDKNGLKHFQLAERIADTFDQYTIFRPEMLLEWEASKETGIRGDWQAVLWRALVTGSKGYHRGRLKDEFSRRMMTGMPVESGIPERITVFGISYLPKYHMEILATIARITDVNLFLLSPTREYWADIISSQAKARLTDEAGALRIEGHPLLASLGRLGRDFSDMVIEIGDVAAVQEDLYEDPGGVSLLQNIQRDILNLSDPGKMTEKRPIDQHDRSIQIHSCHSPMREIEILYDNILALLERVEGLVPRDIVVMTPDIETYAPYISSVFDGSQDASLKIPYSIADRRLKSEGQIAAVLLKLLGLPGSRLTVIQLFDILEANPVRRRFDLNNEELAIIRVWIEDTWVRWGIDEQSRIRLGLPGYRENSWRAGLDRLLLGYAMPDENGRLFNGKLPYDEIEGSSAQTLGKLVDFINKVADIADSLIKPRTLGEWQDQCGSLLADFITADEDMVRELTTVAGLVANIGELAEQSEFDEKVELGVIRAWLTARLDQEEKGLGFITGGVTFCAMLPMRSIPFRVVALIGMNDGGFPRQNFAPGFDLIARNPRRGDRSLRDEDRYLFLESILSARDCLYISYIGQSIKDNSEIPPSVLVSELLDVIDRGFTAGKDNTIEGHLVTRHRLQAFSRDYFADDSPLFSYSAENCAALKAAGDTFFCKVSPAAEFLAHPLAAPTDEWRDVPLIKLLRFFDNPAKFFLENRLGIRLEDVVAPLEEREPFAVDGLDAYNLKKDLLDIVLQGGNAHDYLSVARCRGIIPPARHGEIVFETAVGEVETFARTVQANFGDKISLAPLDFELNLSGFRLTGRLDEIWPERMIRYRCAKLKAKDQLRAWIEHLVLNAARKEAYPRETLLIMTNGTNTFNPVQDAAAVLQIFLDIYWQGLTTPLRFFPASAMAYAERQEWNLGRARGKWEDGYNDIPGEGRDPYFRLCFGHVDPFNAEFERIAHALLEPMLQHLV
jgi:exodeoxyribonuclease V gamma subunit